MSGRGRGRGSRGKRGDNTRQKISTRKAKETTVDSGSDHEERATASHGASSKASSKGSRPASTSPDRQPHSRVRQVPSPVSSLHSDRC